jgi:hypothetical protein
VELRSARNYACDGCYETIFPGETEFSFFYIPGVDVLEKTLNSGAGFAFSGGTYFDATDVDPTTVFFAGAGVKLDKKGNPVFKTSDVNDDGLTDLIVKIVAQDLDLESGHTLVTLTGETFDGTLIEGKGVIQVKQQMCVRTLQ